MHDTALTWSARTVRRAVGWSVLLWLVACAGGCAGARDGMTVRRALRSTGRVEVTAFLVATGSRVHLCDEVAESLPPQCGAERLEVEGLELTSVEGLRTMEDVSWTERPVTVSGELRDGLLDAG